MVAAFHRQFASPPPAQLDVEGFPGALRVSLIEEEASEFATAVQQGDVVEMVDALCDLLYVTYGAAVDLGVDLEPFFDAVHESNLQKVGGTRRADGKWLKPAGWEPPDIAGLLRRLYGVSGASGASVEPAALTPPIRP